MLFDLNYEDSFLSAIKPLVAESAVRERIGARAAATIRERFSVTKVADRYLNLYQEILEGH
jgi:glycosyltransferase involved in cell wall biosynthesis